MESYVPICYLIELGIRKSTSDAWKLMALSFNYLEMLLRSTYSSILRYCVEVIYPVKLVLNYFEDVGSTIVFDGKKNS